jgi:DNA-binding response OmpR family regulator
MQMWATQEEGAVMGEAATGTQRLLVVDDDTYLHVMVSLALPHVTVLEAATIAEGVALAETGPLAGIVIDRRLPDGDGLDLVRRLRETEQHAGHQEWHRMRVLRAGADEYLAKPFDPDHLMARLERLLRLAGPDRDRRRGELTQRLWDGEQGDPDPLHAGVTATSDEDEGQVAPARERTLFSALRRR